MGQPSQSPNVHLNPSFRLKGGLFPLTLIELTNGDLQRLRDDLQTKVAEAPGFFQQAPTVLSLELLEEDSPAPDLQAIRQLCLEFGLIVVALRGADETLQAAARELNLAILSNTRTTNTRTKDERDEPAAATASVDTSTTPAVSAVATAATDGDDLLTDALHPAATRVITTPVRSGQQIYAAGGDLIVLAPVSAGAELLADGNIHVYGPLRGRALAGVKGNTEARIFCQSLEAELISIAGYFKLNDDLRETQWKQSVQAYLTEETLHIEPLQARGW